MKNKQILILVFLVIFTMLNIADRLVKAPASKGLDGSFKWATGKTHHNRYVAYSVKIMMGENSFCGSHYHGSREFPSIGEVITGDRTFSKRLNRHITVKEAAKRALKSHQDIRIRNERQVLKSVAVLFRMEKGKKAVSKISFHTYDSAFDLEDYKVYWLGEFPIEDSIAFLKKQFNRNAEIKLQKQLVSSIALHRDEAIVKPFLKKVIAGSYDDKVRGNAIFWLGEYHSADVIKILDRIARGSHTKLAKKAVFSLYRVENKAAEKSLIDLAMHSGNRQVKKNAIFWLGQKASKRSAEVLGDIAQNDKDVSMQKKAVFALSQLPGDSGVDKLVKIAKTHQNYKVRKSAIFWLGQSDNPKGLKTILDILEK